MEEEEYRLKKLKKYWNKLYYGVHEHKYNLQNLRMNTGFCKDIEKMFEDNPLNLYTIEHMMHNLRPSKKKFDYIQHKEFFEIIRMIVTTKEYHKYQKHYKLCKSKNIEIKDFVEILY